MLHFFFRCIFVILSVFWFGVLPLQAASEAAAGDCFSTAWPHEQSNLKPDPELIFGRLDNGFRYVLKVNREPADRVALFLDVQAGSINEKEGEQGIAHFLEHMVFNGSTHFRPGELVGYFQSLGMSFGGDTNAHTNYTETVYKLILPDGQRSDLDKGLLVLNDYASGALLLEKEVERERGVILAEKTARDSAGYRAHLKKTSFELDGTLIPQRNVIGNDTVLQSADSEILRHFYEKWYRPENMVLVLVGDFEIEDAKTLIAKHFSGVKGKGPVPECPDYGQLRVKDDHVFYFYEPEQGYTDVTIEVLSNKKRQHDSLALRQETLYQLMAARIINHRLEKLAEQAGSAFSQPYYYAGPLFDRFQTAGIKAQTSGDKWRDTLAALDKVLRQVVTFGFTDAELARVKKEFLNEIEDTVLTQDTRNSLVLAASIIDNVNSDRVMQSPEQEALLYAPFIRSVNAEKLHDLFDRDWQNRDWLVQIVGDAKLPGPDEEQYLSEYVDSLKNSKIEPPIETADLVFPYLTTPRGTIKPVKTEEFADIGVTRYTYGNGLILNLKKTDFKENEVSVSINFGDGKKSVLLPGLAMLAEDVVNGSGTGTLRRTALQQLLSGSSVQYGFRIGEDSFSWEGSCVANDTELLFQVLQAVILDPGFRPETYEQVMKAAKLMFQRMERDIDGKLRTRIEPFFTGNNAAFGLPEWQQFQSLTLRDVSDWLLPYFNRAPLEISVVGDIDRELVEQIVSRFFGFLENRDYQQDFSKSIDFPAGESLEVNVNSSISKSVIRLAWLTDDFWDIHRTRRLNILAAVLEDRLRKSIREKLGSSYAPAAYSMTSRVYPGFGMLVVQVVVDNELLDSIKQEVLGVVATLKEQPVDLKELNRAQKPFLTSLKETIRTNGYWLHSVLALSSRYSQQLVWPLQMIDDYRSITVEDINLLAETYLIESRLATGIVRATDGT